MIQEDAYLNPHIFDDDVEQAPIRNGYGEGLVAAGKQHDNVVVLTADLAESTRSHMFAEKFPERFFEVGVAEQNMATIAAGLGVSGKIPFISSYATFSPGRNWEQIRTTIAYNDANVKIAGHHAGVSTGPDGATHQAIEDIATMRAMPNMKVIVPCDALEAQKATEAAAQLWGPVYLRFARAATPVITTTQTPFTPGVAQMMWNARKPDAVIIAAGTMVYEALRAAELLEEEKVRVLVLNNHTIKPLDEKTLVAAIKRAKAVVTAEEHNVLGGLGGAVAELVARTAPVPMEFVGMQDTFGESGLPHELLEKYGMDTAAIVKAVKHVIRRK